MNSATFGLLAINKDRSGEVHAIPLLGVEVQADITGRSCKVKVRQAYKNTDRNPVEAIYKFPLPEGATVCGFKAHVGDKIFAGKVEEREKAFERYDDAVMDGDGGYLLDQDRPNICTLRVGNLNSGMKAVLEVEYVELVESNSEEVRFFLPTTISPRYIPGNMGDVNGMPPGETVNPPISLDFPYGLKLRLSVHDRDAIASIESPSHKINVQMSDSTLIVELSEETAEMDRDFVLNIRYKTNGVSKAYAIQKGPDTFYQVDFCPQMAAANVSGMNDSDPVKKDIVFLLDCSGSMAGESIAQAKQAIEVFIKALRDGVYFNVYSFGSSFNKVFSESVPYSSSNVRKALNALSQIDADLGDTEIMAPMRDILQRDGVDGHKDVIILTDGQIGHEEEVLDLVNGARKRAKIFTVGIGYGPNEYFFKQVARTSGGAFEHIAPGERIEPKVIRLFSKVTTGAVTDLKVHWPDKTTQAPENAVAFLGSRSSIFGRVIAQEHPDNIKITGTLSGKKQEWLLPVNASGDIDSATPRLWAREKIRDLEGSIPGRDSSVAIVKDKKMNDIVRQIIELSEEFQVMSSKTSFVAVEERDEQNKTLYDAVTLRIPTQLTKGWGGTGKAQRELVRYCLERKAVSRMSDDIASFDNKPLYSLRSRDVANVDNKIAFSLREDDGKMSAEEPKTSPEKVSGRQEDAESVVIDLLNLQKPDGGFEIDDNAAMYFDTTINILSGIANRIDVKRMNAAEKFLLLSTVLVLALLKNKYAAEKGLWQAAVEKSIEWLKDECKNMDIMIQGKSLEEWAEEYVKNLIKNSC